MLDVAAFVVTLRGVPAGDGPPPRRRGGPMARRDREVRWALAELEGLVDSGRAFARLGGRPQGRAMDQTRRSGSTATCFRATSSCTTDAFVESSTGAGRGWATPPAMPCSDGAFPPVPVAPFGDAAGFDDATWAPGPGLGGGADGPLHPRSTHDDAAPCGRPGGAAVAGHARGLNEPTRDEARRHRPSACRLLTQARTRPRARHSRVRGPGCDTRHDRGMTTSCRPCRPCHPCRPPWRRPRRRGRPSRACRLRGPRWSAASRRWRPRSAAPNG